MQKELKAKYIDIVMSETWGDYPSMRKNYEKTVDAVIELSDGSLIAIDKPSIQTRFCFGYHDSRYNTDDFDRANDMARHARTHEDYFIEENLKGIDEMLEELKAADGNVFIRTAYYRAPEDTKIKSFSLFGNYDVWRHKEGMLPEYTKIEQADINKIIEAYEEVRSRFVKRLNTYLKRYGLSKVDSWSYWLDA